MISFGCPNGHGALYVESFKAEGKRFTEIICLLCARLWTPQQIPAIISGHSPCCGEETRARYKRELVKVVTHEGAGALIAAGE